MGPFLEGAAQILGKNYAKLAPRKNRFHPEKHGVKPI
jgi:hypothetical protein